MAPATVRALNCDYRSYRGCIELLAQAGEQSIDIFVDGIELGEFVEQTGYPSLQLLPGVGQLCHSCRQIGFSVAVKTLNVCSELVAQLTHGLDQILDSAVFVLLERREARLQRRNASFQVDQCLHRPFDLIEPGMGAVDGACELLEAILQARSVSFEIA